MLFSFFQEFGFLFFFCFFFGWRGRRAKNGPKWNDKRKLSHHSVFQELYLMWLWLLVLMCKMMMSPAIFFIFCFSGFSKFINKCQKEFLSCAPPSSHVCDFIWFTRFTSYFSCGIPPSPPPPQKKRFYKSLLEALFTVKIETYRIPRCL